MSESQNCYCNQQRRLVPFQYSNCAQTSVYNTHLISVKQNYLQQRCRICCWSRPVDPLEKAKREPDYRPSDFVLQVIDEPDFRDGFKALINGE